MYFSFKPQRCETRGPEWGFAKKYATVVIDLIKAADELWKKGHEQEIKLERRTAGNRVRETQELVMSSDVNKMR